MRMKTIAGISVAALLLAGCEARKAQTPGKPPNPGSPQTITLVPSGSGANTTWKVLLAGNPQPQDPDKATTVIPEGDGPTKFTVNIAGNPAGIKFRAQNPLSVWAGPKLPAQSGIDTQIVGPIFEQGKLVFWDLNYGPQVKLSYAIHFEGNVPSVDPIIENGGGNWSR
jgi:hypothetical protein